MGGVGLAAFGAVAGGVEMPFCRVSAATGDAIVGECARLRRGMWLFFEVGG